MEAMKLNVVCDKCNKGKLLSPFEGFDGDYYEVECDHCDASYRMHYTAFDGLQDQSHFNDVVCEDVKVLGANGSFVWVNGLKMNEQEYKQYVEGYKLIQMIEVNEVNYYYQKGADFLLIMEEFGEYQAFKYQAKEDKLPNLIAHFFKD